MSKQQNERQKQPCRGFECVGYKYEKYPNEKGEYRGCEIKKVNMTLLPELLCEDCEFINDCAHCIHEKTCKYSSVKK